MKAGQQILSIGILAFLFLAVYEAKTDERDAFKAGEVMPVSRTGEKKKNGGKDNQLPLINKQASDPGRQTLLLSGEDWLIHAAEGADIPAGTGWIQATVPGNIQSDLEDQHKLEPLSYGPGDPRLLDVCRKDWWYKKEFVAPAGSAGRRNVIVFDGVDYSCQVWLNGKLLGRNAGMFRRFEFDVSSVIIPGKNNLLAVRIDKIPDELVPYLVGSDGKNSGFGTDYYFLNAINKTRQVLKDLKTSTNLGWDWVTNIWTMGIWKDVRLETTGASKIQWVQVKSRLYDNYKKATVSVKLDLHTLGGNIAGSVKFRLRGNGTDKQTEKAVRLDNGNSSVTGEIQLSDPALWWPNGQGDQPLYTVESILFGADGARMDSVSTRFGIRELTWGEVEGAPRNVPQDASKAPGLSRPNMLHVNGRPVRLMGCNMAPPNLLPGNIMRNGPKLMQLAHDAHINTFRLWGGGVLPEKMFDLADELGIMLIQEIPLVNSRPETDDIFVGNLTVTTRNIVRQVRNHPSIVEWSGGNEMAWWTGMDHKALNAIEKTIAEEDGRMFRATSPVQGGRHGKYFYLPSNYSYYNDPGLTEHWGTGPMMRSAEYGAESPANLEVWQRDVPFPEQWPIIPERDGNNLTLIRKNVFYAMGEDWWLGKNVITSLFGEPKDLDEMVRAGQFIGAEGVRLASDALRRRGAKLGGMFTWVFNEPWSNGAGSFHVDHDGVPLMNYYFEADALRPVSISLKYFSITYNRTKGIDAELWITSDLPQKTGNLSWEYTIRTSSGLVAGKGRGKVKISPQQALKVKNIHIAPPADLGPVLVELKLSDAAGLLAERVHVFGVDGVGSVFAGLLNNAPADNAARLPGKIPEIQRPVSVANFAYVGNGARPATASSTGKGSYNATFMNDGNYGTGSAWMPDTAQSDFQIDLGQVRTIGTYKIGRDRSGTSNDHPLAAIKIETSVDGHSWIPVFEHPTIQDMPVYTPMRTVEVMTAPVKARYVKVKISQGVIDEFEIYAPADPRPARLPAVRIEELPQYTVPLTRTNLTATLTALPGEEGKERIKISLANTGQMTALFCKVQPSLVYRTDLFFSNNFIIVPPGETREIIVKAPVNAASGLTLLQTGWSVRSWNADEVIIKPSADVLFSFGRADKMSREYAGYENGADSLARGEYAMTGLQPDAARIPWIVTPQSTVKANIDLPAATPVRNARLYLRTSDQSVSPCSITVTVNGTDFSVPLPGGLGKQDKTPYHLAYPYTAILDIPADVLRSGKNSIGIRAAKGWFTWDACQLISR